jgi:hypothetical protein
MQTRLIQFLAIRWSILIVFGGILSRHNFVETGRRWHFGLKRPKMALQIPARCRQTSCEFRTSGIFPPG